MSLVFLENRNRCLIYTCDGHIIDDKLIHSQYFFILPDEQYTYVAEKGWIYDKTNSGGF